MTKRGFNPDTTLHQVHLHIREHWDKGCTCPGCGQHVQLYHYNLYATSAVALIRLYRLDQADKDEYFHVRDFAEAAPGRPRASHFAELRFWKLVKPSTIDERPKKKSSGYWAITEKGRLFVRGSILVQSSILVYNNMFQGFADNSEMINIQDALGNKFNYEQMMQGGIS